MEGVPDFAGLKEALIVLGAAGLVIPLFHRLRVSPVFGFMLVGVAVGPFGLGQLVGRFPLLSFVTMQDPAAIAPLAQFGVVLLLFMIGLELSFARLWVMRRLVFGLGPLQLVLSAVLLSGAALYAGVGWQAAVVLGLAGAMSSTAVGLQVLAERRALNTRFGRAGFAVLLFQDLAVMPVLFAIGLLIPNGAPAGGPHALLLAGGQGLLAVAAIVGLGRLALRPLFRSVARTQSPDLFMAACLLVVIGAAVAAAAAHLSMALGALIGGLLLAATEYRREVEVTIEPFKGLLVGVFLISVGMGLDLGWVVAHPLIVFGACAVLLAVKLAVVLGLGRGFGLSWAGGTQLGLLLAPGGEFGFVILAAASGHRLLAPPVAQTALVVTALTMAAIPAAGRARRAHRAAAGAGGAGRSRPARPRDGGRGAGGDRRRVRPDGADGGRPAGSPRARLAGDRPRCRWRRPRAGRRPAGVLRRREPDRAAARDRHRHRHGTGGDDGRPRRGRCAGGGGAAGTGGPADHRPRARRGACGASLSPRRLQRGAGNDRGEPATGRGGADRPRRADGPGDRVDPRDPRRVAGRDPAHGPADRAAPAGRAAGAAT